MLDILPLGDIETKIIKNNNFGDLIVFLHNDNGNN